MMTRPNEANMCSMRKTQIEEPMTTPATKPTPEIINDDQLNEKVNELVIEGLNSRQIGERLGIMDTKVRNSIAWKAAGQKGTRKNLTTTDSTGSKGKLARIKKRRPYGSIAVPRTKAGLLKSLKAASDGLRDELRKSPNSYQCNYFVIRNHAETICLLLEKVLTEE